MSAPPSPRPADLDAELSYVGDVLGDRDRLRVVCTTKPRLNSGIFNP